MRRSAPPSCARARLPASPAPPGCRRGSWAVLARSSARRCASGSSRRTPRAAAAILGDLDRAPRAPPLRVAAERRLGLPSQVGGVVRGAAPILPGAAERAEQPPRGLAGRSRLLGAVAGHGTPHPVV